MKQLLILIIGMLIGASISYFVLKTNNNLADKSEPKQRRQEILQRISNSLSDLNKAPEVQYIEIRGKKANVRIHTGMTKDSVRIIIGKPDKVDLRTYSNSTTETWGYFIKNKREYQLPDLTGKKIRIG